jgi:putative transcriptional regulator
MTDKTYPDYETRLATALAQAAEMLEHPDRHDRRTFERPAVDVAAIRNRHGMTQQAFADAFGIPVGTLRNWEQGRRSPEGPARLLLAIIDRRPDVAAEVLGDTPPTDAVRKTGPAVIVGSVNRVKRRESSVWQEQFIQGTIGENCIVGQKIAIGRDPKGGLELIRPGERAQAIHSLDDIRKALEG